MISLEAYSDLLATLHAAPLDDAHWQQFLGQLCDFTHSLYGIFTSNDSALDRRILAHSGMPAIAEAHRTCNQSFRHKDARRSNARVLVLATGPETKVNFPDAILRALYDFTQAETDIANGLLTGYSLDEVALLRKTSPSTTRSRIKRLFGKTSTRRQGELIQLLSSLPRTPPAVAQRAG